VTKGVKKGRDEGRITITLECKLPQELMSQLPGWQTDATDALRKMMAEWSMTDDDDVDLVTFLVNSGVIVTERYDVSK
jgi:hypothetical protein